MPQCNIIALPKETCLKSCNKDFFKNYMETCLKSCNKDFFKNYIELLQEAIDEME